MAFAARVTDMHVCPMQTPAVVPIPHVGGPIIQPGAVNVLIGGLPPAVAGGMCTCVGPPDTILPATTGARARVMVGGMPIAAMGDMTAHGGTIVIGCPTVLIGTGGMSMPEMPDMSAISDLTNEIASTTQGLLDEQAELEALLENDPYGPQALAAQARLDELNDTLGDMDATPEF